MRPVLLGAGGLLLCVGVVMLRLMPQAEPPGAPEVPVDKLAASAATHLAEAGDSAAIVDLLNGRLLFEHHPLALRQGLILPGSVMKIFTAYALIEADRADRRFVCKGEHRDALGQTRPCWLRPGHGPMQLRTAIAESCNVWFFEQSQHLDDRRLLEVYRAFGIGAPWPRARDHQTAIQRDLVPSALPARDLPDVAVGDHISFRVTPMSLLRAVAVIATRGRRIEVGADSRSKGPPGVDAGLDGGALELIAEGMAEATASGTLSGVFEPAQHIAAKTGTAKKWQVRGMRGLVVGFFPAEAPRFAFVVVKDEGQGARDAGPPARALLSLLAPPATP